MYHIEATPGHNTGIIATTPGVTPNVPVPHTGVTAIKLAMIHTEVPHPTIPEIKADPIYTHPTNPPGEICTGPTCTPVDHKVNHITRRTPE